MPTLFPDLTTVLNAYLQGHSNYFGVATPGVVTAAKNVSGRTVTVSAQPAVHKLVESEADEDVDDVEEYVPIQDVPVCWLVGRGIQVNATLEPGDPVLLVCLDRDPSEWRRTGRASEPNDVRLHDWAHCVAIPGLVPNTSPLPAPTDAAALASRLDALISLIKGQPYASLQGAVSTAFPGYSSFTDPPVALTPPLENTTGSTVLKLSS